MKKKINYLIGIILVIALSGICYFGTIKKAYSQDAKQNQTVVVREYISLNTLESSEIVIAYSDNKPETIELENFRQKHWEENTSKLEYILTKLINNGYTIVTSNGSGGGQSAFLINTYVLKK